MEKNNILTELEEILKKRILEKPEGSYTVKLITDSPDKKAIDKILEKIGEESVEIILGAKNKDKKNIICETADLIYHLMVLLTYCDIPFENVLKELEKRRK